MNSLDKLRDKHKRYLSIKYPSFPTNYYPEPNWMSKTSTTNGLTQAVISYIEWSGWSAERTGNEGRVMDERKQYTDALGHRKTMGTVKRIKGQGKKGTSDIKAVIAGRFVAIEIKSASTKDRMSEAQLKYKAEVERSGAIYKVITNLDEAIEWLDTFGENTLTL